MEASRRFSGLSLRSTFRRFLAYYSEIGLVSSESEQNSETEMPDGQGGQEKIVAQKGQSGILLGIEIVDAPQGIWIALSGSDSGQQSSLVAPHSRRGFDRARGATVEWTYSFWRE
jgi:hypothetical protein